ncbi:AMP-binding protein [Streptomyces malaysiensis]|uniref:AMP-binding protein n=1 Tax=Streptomyces malaysiensis TaxID=92644 RepID=UPI0038500715
MTTEELSHAAAEPDQLHTPAPDDLALLMLTSGSTGSSKAVRLTHANLLAAQAGKAGALELGPDDTSLNWISVDHIAAIEAHLLPMFNGADQVMTTPATVLADPVEFLRLLTAHRVRVTFTPNFLFGQINQALTGRPASEREVDLSSVRHIISGGEATVTATVRAFLDTLSHYGLRGDVIVPAFGMTEICAGSVFNRDFATHDLETEFPPRWGARCGACGFVSPTTTARCRPPPTGPDRPSRARCSCTVRWSPTATSAMSGPPHGRSPPTAGSAPGIWATSIPRAG